MAELSDVLMMKALEDDNNHDTWGLGVYFGPPPFYF